MSAPRPLRLVVLISGSGSNLQAILDACQDHTKVNAEVVAVISNRPNVYGLERAKLSGVASEVLDHKAFDGRESFDQALAEKIDNYQPDLVILAGFMRILTADFVDHYAGRMLNIHPSLLPKYQGLHTHRRALENGDKQHGASIHYVTAELDGGPVILQAAVPILEGDDEASLAARVLLQEHQIYPAVIHWIAEGRLRFENNQPWLDGKALAQPLSWPQD